MTEPLILFERPSPHVAVLTLNRPEVLNAVNHATIDRLNQLLAETDADPTVRAVVLTGRGRAFSSGADLKEQDASGDSATLADVYRELHTAQEVTRRFLSHHAVCIAALNGIAVGIGAELAVNADVRIGSEQAELFFSESKRGLFQTNGVLHLLPRIVGQSRAAHWLLTSQRIKAPELLAAGFLSEVTAPDRLLARAVELAETIAANAPISIQLIKKLLHRTWEVDLEAMLQYEIDGMLACLASEDVAEGIRAFLERRAPVWQGR